MGTEISYCETSDDRENIKKAACNGQLEKVIELSTKFNDDMKLLSETLIESCREGSSRCGEVDGRTYCS